MTKNATLPKKTGSFTNYQKDLCQILISQIEDFNEDCVKISRLSLLYFQSNKSSKNVMVGSGWARPVHRFK